MLKRTVLLSLLLAAGSLHAQDKAAEPNLAKGKEIAETLCVACHGADGNSPLPENPKIAGQIPEYLYKQLVEFKGADGNPPVRVNAIMNGMVMALSDEDMNGLAHYFADQKLDPAAAKNAETVELGQKLWRSGDATKGLPACAACHGPAGKGLPIQYPQLAGQFAQYTAAQLKMFRSGERANDPASMMRTIALKMTDPEIEALSDYIAGLR